MLRRTPLLIAAALASVLTALDAPSAIPSVASTPHRASVATPHPPKQHLSARSALPPGESGLFPIGKQVAYASNQHPSDFGPHVDDQRLMYWRNQTKYDNFGTPTGQPQVPKAGVKIYRGTSGVPIIYGHNGYDVWYGAGYAAATDRLFEMDAIRRLAEGRLGELTGSGAVPADLEERILTYTPAELHRMYHRLSKRGRQAISGYAAGVEQRIQQVRANPSALLPGEYVLLTSLPEAWTRDDTLATGVFLTRTIASQGGEEMVNVATLRLLEQKYGITNGREIFNELFPDDEPHAAVTIDDRTFHNLPAGDRSAADQARDARKAENYADTIPLSLASGPGTGASAVPSAAADASLPKVPTMVADEIRRADAAIQNWGHNLHGGSFAYAISGSRTKTGEPVLSSNPQLDYSYPSELYELEVHGGGYDARGVGVPGIPTVGIGHTASVAWGLTTGYSKTIDSFIETTRNNPLPGGPPQYRHNGRWRNEKCRTVVVRYRATGPQGIPAGPANQSESAQACRTIHGPVVATTPNGKRARTVDYAQWKQDDETVDGILAWDRAKTLKQVAAGVRKVRWNENIIAADSAGHIGYWHPGRYFNRARGVDQRFPLRGTGSQDERGYLPFRRMPHVVDPPDGYVANWNTKPARGWVDGDLSGTNTRPGGPANRVRDLQTLLAAGHHFGRHALGRIDERVGEDDHRYLGYWPIVENLRHAPTFGPADRKSLRMLLRWDGRAYAPGVKGGSSPRSTPAAKVTDGPAATLFAAFTAQLKNRLFHSLPQAVRARLDTLSTESHQYDVTPLDNDAIGLLIPGFNGLPTVGPRRRLEIEEKAFIRAEKAMRATYGSNPHSWRRPHGISHIDSLSGVIGPSTVMPFQDRGTWVQNVTFEP